MSRSDDKNELNLPNLEFLLRRISISPFFKFNRELSHKKLIKLVSYFN
jgi:hypothetical protein